MIVTYHPHLNVFDKIMRKNLKHLQADQTVKSVFTPVPFVSFRIARKLRSHLVRSELYPLQRAIGSCKCNTPRCQGGKNVKKCYEFSSHVTKETFKINHYFDCNIKSLICLIPCKVCGKQYIGSKQRGSGFDGIITSLAKEKLREGRTACKGIFMSTF